MTLLYRGHSLKKVLQEAKNIVPHTPVQPASGLQQYEHDTLEEDCQGHREILQ